MSTTSAGHAIAPDATDPAARPALGLAEVSRGAPLDAIAELAAGCRACDLWAHATQTVFGQGPWPAPLMLVGEQPGDREDVEGAPFVGPAGQLLDRALGEAGVDREKVFITNVVKHFKWRPSGKRRLHEKPNKVEVAACHPWLEAELALVRPEALVCLGATAAGALLGPSVRVSQLALTPVQSPLAPLVLATLHPSAILRAPDGEGREVGFARLVGDLRLV
ncbi:MAG TPA: UdgX family uracil-DNA binding protein, partial [Candidatus Limnocylindrales bacterium]|nr:UdgX family uracil-DNA binding protein [Candidatus Limnocylindrales bacterium]